MVLLSCDQKNEKPEGLLDHDQMVDLIYDVHLVEGARSGVTIMGDSMSLETYYRTVMIKHNMDSVSYKNNMEYYSSRPDEMKVIFDEVIEKLSVLESELRP